MFALGILTQLVDQKLSLKNPTLTDLDQYRSFLIYRLSMTAVEFTKQLKASESTSHLSVEMHPGTQDIVLKINDNSKKVRFNFAEIAKDHGYVVPCLKLFKFALFLNPEVFGRDHVYYILPKNVA